MQHKRPHRALLESLFNLMLDIPVIYDFAAPLYHNPLQLDANVVVFSCTKHIDG